MSVDSSTADEAVSYGRIFSLPDDISYEDAVKYLLTLNKRLRSDGIWAPNDGSLETVQRLYSHLGSPLDSQPVLHVGGTNGKVNINETNLERIIIVEFFFVLLGLHLF